MHTDLVRILTKTHRHAIVLTSDHRCYKATVPPKFRHMICGDQAKVRLDPSGKTQLLDLHPRRNLFQRSEGNRSKKIAANLDHVFVLTALQPTANLELLQRIGLEASRQQIPCSFIINKIDLLEDEICLKHPDLAFLQVFQNQYPLIFISVLQNKNIQTLHQHMQGKVNLLIGESGCGKSSLTRLLTQDLSIKTQALSVRSNRGKHTTSASTARLLAGNTLLIDTPGLQSFGLHHLDFSTLPFAFPDIAQYALQCRYRNCFHLDEPDCAVKAQVNQQLHPQRYALYAKLAKHAAI